MASLRRSHLVGDWYEDEDATGGNGINYAGSSYIFERDSTGNWNQAQKIVASDRAKKLETDGNHRFVFLCLQKGFEIY